eukprot:5055885-Amphidinium_carterae.7
MRESAIDKLVDGRDVDRSLSVHAFYLAFQRPDPPQVRSYPSHPTQLLQALQHTTALRAWPGSSKCCDSVCLSVKAPVVQ